MQKIIQDRNKKLLVDITGNSITLLDGRFYYTEDGDPIPSVTTILDAYPKGPAFYEWLKTYGKESDEIMNAAGRRGSSVHDMTDRYDRGERVWLIDENSNLQMYMSEWGMFERYIEFVSRIQPKYELIEQNIVSKKIGVAGTIDRVGTIPDLGRVLIDIKTSPQIYDHFWVQLAAYEVLLFSERKIKIDKIAILHLNSRTRTDGKKGDIQGEGWKLCFPTESSKYYWDLFESTKKLWMVQNSKMIPKNLEYQLSHQKKPLMKIVKK